MCTKSTDWTKFYPDRQEFRQSGQNFHQKGRKSLENLAHLRKIRVSDNFFLCIFLISKSLFSFKNSSK